MKLFLLLSMFVSFSVQLVGAVDASRTVKVIGPIDSWISHKSTELLMLADPELMSKKDIYILINSPGGMVMSGMGFLDAMVTAKDRGYTVHCIVGTLAASMAFQMLTECSSIKALPHSRLLWHRPYLAGNMKLDSIQLAYLASQLTVMEDNMFSHIKKYFSFRQDFLIKHAQFETMWFANELAKHTRKIRIVRNVKGLDKDLFSLDSGLPFMRGPNSGSVEFIYIHPSRISN